MNIKQILCLVLIATASNAVGASQLVSSFEGDFSSTYGVDWTTLEGVDGIRETFFIDDDPLDLDTEGVTEGSQALGIAHTNWDSGNQPWLILSPGTQAAQSILEYDQFAIDMTPLVDLEGPGIGFRQAFLATRSNTNNFGFIQVDYDLDTPLDPDTGQREADTLIWDMNTLVPERDTEGEFTGVEKTFKQYAQDAINAGEEGFMDLILIFQGANNNFFDFPIQVAIDNVRFQNVIVPIVGDYNVDGQVDAADYTVWRDNDGGPADAFPNRDPALLGNPIGTDDYVAWTLAYGDTGSAAAVAVPEPGSAVFVFAALLAGSGVLGRGPRLRSSRRGVDRHLTDT